MLFVSVPSFGQCGTVILSLPRSVLPGTPTVLPALPSQKKARSSEASDPSESVVGERLGSVRCGGTGAVAGKQCHFGDWRCELVEWCFSGVGRAQFVHSLKDTLSADTLCALQCSTADSKKHNQFGFECVILEVLDELTPRQENVSDEASLHRQPQVGAQVVCRRLDPRPGEIKVLQACRVECLFLICGVSRCNRNCDSLK